MADTNPTPRVEGEPHDGPSSNETCGQFPYDEVLATYEDAPPPPEGTARASKSS